MWCIASCRRFSCIYSLLSNFEDGIFVFQSSVTASACYFESNGLGGSGNGLNSHASRKLVVEGCVFAHHQRAESVGLRVHAGGQQHESGGDNVGGSLQVASSSSGGNDVGHAINAVTSCDFISNSVGLHASLSPDAEPPGVVGCRFFGNTKIGYNTPARVAMRCD
jgi:hypothetical protein